MIDGDRDDTESTSAHSPLTRRWRRLNRGWQALCLGLFVVAVHAAGFTV
ncbi:MAG: hypothetical protein J07HB67_01291 [halophilic archaeon J07HB67]|nr:MAG: hypothetical protein J07HB67_01291 [halophilic archaeon J07HB67]